MLLKIAECFESHLKNILGKSNISKLNIVLLNKQNWANLGHYLAWNSKRESKVGDYSFCTVCVGELEFSYLHDVNQKLNRLYLDVLAASAFSLWVPSVFLVLFWSPSNFQLSFWAGVFPPSKSLSLYGLAQTSRRPWSSEKTALQMGELTQ